MIFCDKYYKQNAFLLPKTLNGICINMATVAADICQRYMLLRYSGLFNQLLRAAHLPVWDCLAFCQGHYLPHQKPYGIYFSAF